MGNGQLSAEDHAGRLKQWSTTRKRKMRRVLGGGSGGGGASAAAKTSGLGWSGVRCGNGRCGGVSRGTCGSSASAAAKTSELGNDGKIPEKALETARREATLKPMLRRNPGAA